MNKIKFLLITTLLNLFIISNGNSQLIPSEKLRYTSGIKWNEKISPLLEIQLNVKNSFIRGLHKTSLKRFENLGIRTDKPDYHYIYLFFKEYPGASQISEIENMGGTVYLNSWIPPVGAHPFGYILALMPISTLNNLAEYEYIKRIDTAEKNLYPKNNNAAVNINADDVWHADYDGSDVVVGVLDSGLDSVFVDFPNLTGSKDYSAYPILLDDGIANTVTGHGTHVTGSVLGRGTRSGGTYKGMAPNADLVFLKIGNDTTGSATTSAINKAIRDAVDIYDVDIITMSYGGWDTFHDGSTTEDQAVDYAVSQGVPVFISAGNEGNDGTHYSGTVSANDSTGFIRINISNAGDNNTAIVYNLVWYDGLSASNVLDVNYYNSTYNRLESFIDSSQNESVRGTESEISGYSYYVDAGSSIYYVKVINSSGSDQAYHLYYETVYNQAGAGTVTFQNADPFYTLGSPATADSAIAVGAHVTRKYWTAFTGAGPYSYTSDETVDYIATFSSRGPRVDDVQKITLTSPGTAIISVRDSIVYDMSGALVIDNDGTNNGLGPANYYIMQGTSMACPIAAGAAALLLDQDPTLQPWQIRNLLINNTDSDAYTGTVPNNTWGYGKLNIEKVLEASLQGVIYTQTVDATGGYSFTGTDISMNFSTNGTNGYVTTTEVNDSPPGGTTNVGGSLHHVSAIRYWKINTDKTGYTTSITFSYDTATDFIEDESTLRLARRDNDEDTWTEYTDITRNPSSDQITANNVTGFSQWIFASELGDNSLPVNLTEFTCKQIKDKIHISWITESELENLGFNLYRAEKDISNSTDEKKYIKINTELIDGAGNSPSRNEYTFSDTDVQFEKTYFYILEDVNYLGIKHKYDPIEITVTPISEYALFQNYPNPFNPSTTIMYNLVQPRHVKLVIYDILGSEVKTLVNFRQTAGLKTEVWDGRNNSGRLVSSGIYIYKIIAGNFVKTHKMIFMK